MSGPCDLQRATSVSYQGKMWSVTAWPTEHEESWIRRRVTHASKLQPQPQRPSPSIMFSGVLSMIRCRTLAQKLLTLTRSKRVIPYYAYEEALYLQLPGASTTSWCLRRVMLHFRSFGISLVLRYGHLACLVTGRKITPMWGTSGGGTDHSAS